VVGSDEEEIGVQEWNVKEEGASSLGRMKVLRNDVLLRAKQAKAAKPPALAERSSFKYRGF